MSWSEVSSNCMSVAPSVSLFSPNDVNPVSVASVRVNGVMMGYVSPSTKP